MSDNITLSEYIAQSQRANGNLGRLGQGYFSKGVVDGSYLGVNSTFNATYGKKVWDALNNKTVLFNAIKKVDWGNTVGWRLRSSRGTGRSAPVAEDGALPTIDNSTYVGIVAYPKQIVSVFKVSLKGQAVAALEGGIGNQFAVEQEACSRDHVKEIGLECVAGAAYKMSGGTSTTAVFPSADMAANFKVGDVVGIGTSIGGYEVTAADGSAIVISSVSGTTVTFNACTTGGANNSTLFVLGRNGVTSIDDVVAEDGMRVGGSYAKPNAYNFNNVSQGSLSLANGRASGSFSAAANVSLNAGVGRDLTLGMVDKMFEAIRKKGGEPKLIVMGLDQYDKLNQLLQAQQRFMEVSDYIVGVGDERTYPGTRAGFQLATYRGVPILPDPNAPISYSTTGTALGSNVYCLDTDYVEIGVTYPTQYVENRDYLALGKLAIRGMFVTLLETRYLRPDVHCKIGDLNPT